MKKIITLILPVLALIIVLPLQAQPPRKEKIEALKIGFITNKLDLSSEEAKVFWPVYNEYQKELDVLHEERRQKRQDREERVEELSDAEVLKLLDDHILFEQKELDIRKKFHDKFKAVLPPKKVARLYMAEREFKMMLLERLRENRPGKK